MSRIGASTWSAHWPFQSSSVRPSSALAKLVPALLTSTSMPPICSAHVATIRSSASASVTSAATQSAPTPPAAAPPPRAPPEPLGVAGDHQHLRALGRELARGLEADAAARARDDAHLVAEVQVHGRASWRLRHRRCVTYVSPMVDSSTSLTLDAEAPRPYVHLDNRALVLCNGSDCVIPPSARFPWVRETFALIADERRATRTQGDHVPGGFFAAGGVVLFAGGRDAITSVRLAAGAFATLRE